MEVQACRLSPTMRILVREGLRAWGSWVLEDLGMCASKALHFTLNLSLVTLQFRLPLLHLVQHTFKKLLFWRETFT